MSGKLCRTIHITFYKCGSQWVRDVLTDPEIVERSACPLAVSGFDVAASRAWPEQPASTFAGPIYSASYDEWVANARAEDRAIVVLRDPRDLVVSLVFSVGFSHVPSPITQLLRSPICAASDQNRVRLGIFMLTQWADLMRSWGKVRTDNREYVTSYERLIARPPVEFAAICDYLGWKIDSRLLNRVVQRYSFDTRTGRTPGEANPHSHLRKGVSGDWRNYFDRTLGEEFERTFPSLLSDLGYEQGTEWYKQLPAQLATADVPVEQSKADELLKKLADFEAQYMDLQLWRSAAQDRLENINRLTAKICDLEARVAAPNAETEQHLAQIDELTRTVLQVQRDSNQRLMDNQQLAAQYQVLQAAADQRLADVHTLTQKVHDLEARIAQQPEAAGRRFRWTSENLFRS